jgi:hypothetical protein
VGWSEMEVTCDTCGERYMSAINFGSWLARAEQDGTHFPHSGQHGSHSV